MDFYFCETCGKRLTSVDLEQGAARNKKLKGVYCQQCSVGVTTVEFEAIKHGAPEPLASEAPVKSQQAPGRSVDRVSRKVVTSPPKAGIMWPVVGGSAILIVGLLALAGSRNSSDSPKPPIANANVSPPPSPVIAPTPASTLTALPLPKSVQNDSEKPVPNPSGIAEPAPIDIAPAPQKPDPEALAVQDFEKLIRFDGLADDDRTGRIASIEEFLKTHGDTIVAGRARTLIADFEKNDPAKQAPVVEKKVETPAEDIDTAHKTAENVKAPVPPPAQPAQKADPRDKLKPGIREYTLTFQQGQALPEGSIDKYDGCATSSISVQEPKPSYGRHPELFGGEQAHLCPLVQFCLFAREGGMLPNDAEIVEAKLSFYKIDDYGCTFELHRILRPWKDSDVTWKWAAKGDAWKTPGGELDAKVAAKFESPADKNGWCDFDVTESLRDAAKDGRNFGWRAWVVCPGICHYSSSTAKDESRRPKLVLKVRCSKLRGDKQ